jgi:hypothetical protein
VALWAVGVQNLPSDTARLPPSGRADVLKVDVQPSRAAHRDLHVIWVHGDGLQQLLDEGRAIEVGGLGPGSLDAISWRMPANPSNLAAKSDSRLRAT